MFRFLMTLALAWTILLPGVALGVGQVGELAPDFSLPNTAGETVDVAFGQGEVFLMAFVGFG